MPADGRSRVIFERRNRIRFLYATCDVLSRYGKSAAQSGKHIRCDGGERSTFRRQAQRAIGYVGNLDKRSEIEATAEHASRSS
ncbi:hypothetical protein [Streptomyces phaeochromogenes]|uniref:hypothetical protein n=1 Tax=Streptomyces phaeochromogenes TaxID=1923 RepID=UPI00386C247D|nr:hypothetical protein OHB08_42590 [Streptomyces phaeochromogenes]